MKQVKILLADDDSDDCLFFKEALEGFPITTNLTTVNNGNKLMQHLQDTHELPHVLFLDFNMPCKSGLECLKEIKQNKNFKHLPIIIYSTFCEKLIVDQLFDNGAHYFFRKLGQFSIFKKTIQEALRLATQENSLPPVREQFVLIIANNMSIDKNVC